MAVSEQTPYQEFIANGTTTVFPLNFDAKEQDHLIVLVDDVEPPVGDWSFDFNTDQVTFLKAPKANSVIKIRRDTPLKRDGSYKTYDNSFRPEPVNEDLDSIWYKLQEMGVLNWMINNDIKDLGAYVDSLNDETKAAFLAMIEKQGVSMQQLDLYVQGLYKKLANVAVEKGWLAEFIADGKENQKQINDLARIGQANRWRSDKFYLFGEMVLLENGKQVVSVIAENKNDPNLNMTGWKYKDAKFTFFDFGFLHDEDCTNQLEYLAQYIKNNDIVIEDFSGEIYFFKKNIIISAPGKKVKIHTNCILKSNNSFITFTGDIEEVGSIVSVVDNKVTLDIVSNLFESDIIAIQNTREYSFNKYRPYYFDGEIKEVVSASNDIITLNQSLESIYPGGIEDKVYKISPIYLDINMIVEGNGLSAIRFALASNSTIKIDAKNLLNIGTASYACIFDRIYKSKASGSAIKKGSGTTGTDYGFIASNCQDLDIYVDYAYAHRHACAMGGA
ncbi:hypothetical protein HX005_06895, partial [Acinetobacter sp. R933-2]|nr:hypothetical protein [Acinetobacter sp. R933-2]